MAKFLKFAGANGTIVWINPEHVTSLEQVVRGVDSQINTRVHLASGLSYEVSVGVQVVANALEDKYK